MPVEIIGGGGRRSGGGGGYSNADPDDGNRFNVGFNMDPRADAKLASELELNKATVESLRANTPMKKAEAELWAKRKGYQQQQSQVAQELGLPPSATPAQIRAAAEEFRIKSYVTAVRTKHAMLADTMKGAGGPPGQPGQSKAPSQPYTPFRDGYSDEVVGWSKTLRDAGIKPTSSPTPWSADRPRVNFPVHGMSSDMFEPAVPTAGAKSIAGHDETTALLLKHVPDYDPNNGVMVKYLKAIREMGEDEMRALNEMNGDFGLLGKYLEDQMAAQNELFKKLAADNAAAVEAQAAMAQPTEKASKPKKESK